MKGLFVDFDPFTPTFHVSAQMFEFGFSHGYGYAVCAMFITFEFFVLPQYLPLGPEIM